MKKILTYLIAIAALLVVCVNAKAQNGSSPWEGSIHGYKVIAGDAGNDFQWEVVGGTVNVDYMVNSANMTSDSINITWLTDAENPYTLRFTETDKTTLQCATVKELTINVQPNNFEVSTSDPASQCNSAIDTTNAGSNTTDVTFVVDMTTDEATWNPNWEIKFTLTMGGGVSIGTVTATDGSLTGTGTGPYTLTNISAPNSDGTGSTSITVPLNGDAFTTLNPVFTITSAKELVYNTPDTDSGAWGATATVSAIPKTSAIITD